MVDENMAYFAVTLSMNVLARPIMDTGHTHALATTLPSNVSKLRWNIWRVIETSFVILDMGTQHYELGTINWATNHNQLAMIHPNFVKANHREARSYVEGTMSELDLPTESHRWTRNSLQWFPAWRWHRFQLRFHQCSWQHPSSFWRPPEKSK